jgi:hypothetical protein
MTDKRGFLWLGIGIACLLCPPLLGFFLGVAGLLIFRDLIRFVIQQIA